MYDSTAVTAMGSGASTLAVTGMYYSSWALIAIALIALGGTVLAFAKRFRNRNGARP